MDSDQAARETKHALRTATAVGVCMVCVEALNLNQPGLAVWSAYMVLVQYSFTSFQKGVERVLGRGLGILAALVLGTLTRNSWGLGYALETLAVVSLFYVYFSGRLAYTFLNAGLYLAVVMEIARDDPATVVTQGGDLFLAVAVGVAVAVLVAWLTGAERDVAIHTEGEPLWPLDRNRLLHSVMLTVTVAVVQLASHYLRLSTITSLVSVMLLTITPDFQSLLRKGELRVAGAVLAILFACGAILLLMRIPSFPLLVLLMFLGTYLAVSLARTSESWGYAGVQMGLVLPMILVVPHHEFGPLTSGLARIAGALLAIVASILVGLVWAAFFPSSPLPFAAALSSRPPPASPATRPN